MLDSAQRRQRGVLEAGDGIDVTAFLNISGR